MCVHHEYHVNDKYRMRDNSRPRMYQVVATVRVQG